MNSTKADLQFLLCLVNAAKYDAVSNGYSPDVVRRYIRIEDYLLAELERFL